MIQAGQHADGLNPASRMKAKADGHLPDHRPEPGPEFAESWKPSRRTKQHRLAALTALGRVHGRGVEDDDEHGTPAGAGRFGSTLLGTPTANHGDREKPLLRPRCVGVPRPLERTPRRSKPRRRHQDKQTCRAPDLPPSYACLTVSNAQLAAVFRSPAIQVLPTDRPIVETSTVDNQRAGRKFQHWRVTNRNHHRWQPRRHAGDSRVFMIPTM
jgi:hypothetical protein